MYVKEKVCQFNDPSNYANSFMHLTLSTIQRFSLVFNYEVFWPFVGECGYTNDELVLVWALSAMLGLLFKNPKWAYTYHSKTTIVTAIESFTNLSILISSRKEAMSFCIGIVFTSYTQGPLILLVSFHLTSLWK